MLGQACGDAEGCNASVLLDDFDLVGLPSRLADRPRCRCWRDYRVCSSFKQAFANDIEHCRDRAPRKFRRDIRLHAHSDGGRCRWQCGGRNERHSFGVGRRQYLYDNNRNHGSEWRVRVHAGHTCQSNRDNHCDRSRSRRNYLRNVWKQRTGDRCKRWL